MFPGTDTEHSSPGNTVIIQGMHTVDVAVAITMGISIGKAGPRHGGQRCYARNARWPNGGAGFTRRLITLLCR